MFTLNDVVSSDSSVDSDECDSNDEDFVDNRQIQETVRFTETTRSKREILWCGVEDEGPSTSTSTSDLVQPVHSGSLRQEQQKRHRKPSIDPYAGVPLAAYVKGDKMQLFTRTQNFLAVYPDGKVRGTKDRNDPHTKLEMIPTGFPGHVVIKGILANLYVSMNNKGRLRAQGNRDAEMSVFIEGLNGFYFYYLSRHFAHKGWYMGIKKTGKFKNGMKTKLYQKAVQFTKLFLDKPN